MHKYLYVYFRPWHEQNSARTVASTSERLCACVRTAKKVFTCACSDHIKKLRKELYGAAKITLIKQIHWHKDTTVAKTLNTKAILHRQNKHCSWKSEIHNNCGQHARVENYLTFPNDEIGTRSHQKTLKSTYLRVRSIARAAWFVGVQACALVTARAKW